MGGKRYFSYEEIHESTSGLVDDVSRSGFDPEVIVAIAGGGVIPGRIARTKLRVPMFCISFEHYNEEKNVRNVSILRKQWFDDESVVRGKRVLIVDEVDESRLTLQVCCEELSKAGCEAMAIAVVHNKICDKKGKIPDNVPYFAGANTPNAWHCYPWDAEKYGHSIFVHELIAKKVKVFSLASLIFLSGLACGLCLSKK